MEFGTVVGTKVDSLDVGLVGERVAFVTGVGAKVDSSSDNGPVGGSVAFATVVGAKVEFSDKGEVVGVTTRVGGNVSLLGGWVKFPMDGASVGDRVKF